MRHWLLPYNMLSLCTICVIHGEKPLLNWRVLKRGLLQSSWLSSRIFFPNWSGNLNSSPIGGLVIQLNLTLSNHLPAAVLRCTCKYLWLRNTYTFGADCKFVLLLRVTIAGSEQLITAVWSNTLNVDCNEQTPQMILCCEFIYRYEIFCRKSREDVWWYLLEIRASIMPVSIY